jgi:hypothetical protein
MTEKKKYEITCSDCGATRTTNCPPDRQSCPKICKACSLEKNKRRIYSERARFLEGRKKLG